MFNDEDGINRPRFAKTYHFLKEQIPDFIEDEGRRLLTARTKRFD